MFEDTVLASPPSDRTSGASEPVGVAELAGLLDRLARVDPGVDDAGRVDLITMLERVKGAAAAAQARLTVGLYDSQRAADAALKVPVEATARSVGAQVALARRDSPYHGNRHLGLARALLTEMPSTLVALATGQISEWQATVLVRETACLGAADRTEVDARLATRLGEMSVGRLQATARGLAYQLDPHAAVTRRACAEADRRVSLRPAPDSMALLSALLPVKDGVACWAALRAAADTGRAAGDPRSGGALMADLLTERITGRSIATGPDLEIRLVIDSASLIAGSERPGFVPDYGPIPADLAREWAATAAGTPAAGGRRRTRHRAGGLRTDSRQPGARRGGTPDDCPPIGAPADRGQARAWFRRLFTTPGGGELVAMESRRREFTGLLAEFIAARDQTCRTAYCDAPIRHTDHITRHADGGQTCAANGQGVCARCNYLKEHPGWTARPGPSGTGPPHTVTLTTPTGHAYRSHPPPPVGGDAHVA